jgi:hypothetical protein
MKQRLKQFALLMLVSFAISFFAGIVTTWPLARHAAEGISALHRAETGSLRVSIPGDHLQLMYFFQLVREFITGTIPWFYNVYEFNRGDDARYEPDFYYMPFSAVFAVMEILTGNPALAWNVTGFFSLWLGALGTLLLARRFCSDAWVLLAATLAGTVFPYRLVTFLHGSPTGFGIAYVPYMLLGLDYAIRDKKALGGVLAGAVFFFAEGIDLHVFFFLGLVIPFWAAFVYLYEDVSFDVPRIRRTVCALIPFGVFVCLAFARIWIIRAGLQDSVMAGGRTIREVALFSPRPDAYWSLNPDHPKSYVSLTAVIPVMILLGMMHAVWFFRYRSTTRSRMNFWLMLGVLAGILGVLLLGLGPRVPLPRAERLWGLFVRLVPPYRMIRQPAKVLVLLPSLLAVCIALPFSRYVGGIAARKVKLIYGVLSLLLLVEVAWRMDPQISLMDPHQGAYEAVAENARTRGEVPRAVAIVLWPGDSHWSSLHQHYGLKYRIRMLNGYRPRVPTTYFDEVFMPFASLNRGHASDEQLDALLKMGIRHIIIHEDAFPEQVSPFGVSKTLSGLLLHPRIRMLQQDRAVWSFEIMDMPSSEHVVNVPWQATSVTYRWDVERHASQGTFVSMDDQAHGGAFVQLGSGSGSISLPLWGIHSLDDLRLSLRLRGQGRLIASIEIDGRVHERAVDVSSMDDWEWYAVPFPSFEGFMTGLQYQLTCAVGEVDIDYAYIASGVTPEGLQVGEVFVMPAPTLFRAGYTDLASHSVVLAPALVPAADVFYGPRLPFPAGTYNVRLTYTAESDVPLGTLGFRYPLAENAPVEAVVMGGGASVELQYVNRQNLPLTVAFRYNRASRMTIHTLEVERIE